MLAFRVVIRPLFQHLVRQPFSAHPQHERAKPIRRVELAVPLVQPERVFVHVKLAVFRRELVVNAVETAF